MLPSVLRIRAALKKVSGAHIKVGLLIAAVFFALACAVETRAILALESSPNPLEATPDHGQNVYQ
jgi:hypothetical protein